MATANFLYRDTLYAIDNEDDEFLFSDISESIADSLGQFKDLSTSVRFDGESIDGHRNFCGTVLVECDKLIELENKFNDEFVGISVEQLIILRSGYYSGMNLDRGISISYDVKTDNCESGLDSHLDDIIDQIRGYDLFGITEFFDNKDKYDHYIENDIYNQLSKELTKTQNELDKIYHTLGKEHFEEYVKTAQFSNGETFYEKA